MLTEVERAYLAGIIDGEGSIMLMHRKPDRVKSKHRWEYWVLRVSISNTDERLIDWVLERFPEGGRSELKNGRFNQRNAWHWYADSRKGQAVLEAAYPYLLLKRAQADIALAYIATHKLVGRAGHPPEVIAQRRAWAAEMKRLNHRGAPLS